MTFISMNRSRWRLQLMCEVLGISTRTYYRHRNDQDRDYALYLMVLDVFDRGKRTLGYRRIAEGLMKYHGVKANRKKVLRIMRKYGIRAGYVRKAMNRQPKNRRIDENVRPNLIMRNFAAEGPGQKWYTDVTYLTVKGSRAYLSTIIDGYDMSVAAYSISRHNDNPLVISTLNKALAKRKDACGVILHSDQGSQYTSNEYRSICEANGIMVSMSPKGSPVDNSPIESWHALLKKEVLHNNDITSIREYIALVEEWIEYYNTERIRNKKK